MSVKRILVLALAALLALSLFALPGCGTSDDGESTSSHSQSPHTDGEQTAASAEPDEPDVPQATEPEPTEEPVRVTRSAPVLSYNGYTYYVSTDDVLYVVGFAREEGETDPHPTAPVEITNDVAAFLHQYSDDRAPSLLILKNDGTVWRWTIYARESVSEHKEPNFVMDGAKQIYIGYKCFFVLKNDDTLWGWGLDAGMLGTGLQVPENSTAYTSSPTFILDEVESFHQGRLGNRFAIRKDGSLWVWGAGGKGMSGTGVENCTITSPRYLMDDVVSLSFASTSVYALKSDGSLWVWGDNYHGKLGNGSEETVLTPSPLIDGVKDVIVYSQASSVRDDALVYVIKDDDSLWGWGTTGEYGTLRFGSEEASPTPRLIMEGVREVIADRYMTIALKTDGTLVGWGDSGTACIGDEPVTLANNVGSFICDNEDCIAVLTNEGEVLIWGSRYLGNLRNEAPYRLMSGVHSVSFIGGRLVMLCEDGTLWEFRSVRSSSEDPKEPVKICDNVRLD